MRNLTWIQRLSTDSSSSTHRLSARDDSRKWRCRFLMHSSVYLPSLHLAVSSSAKKWILDLRETLRFPNKGLKVHPTGCSILDIGRQTFSFEFFYYTTGTFYAVGCARLGKYLKLLLFIVFQKFLQHFSSHFCAIVISKIDPSIIWISKFFENKEIKSHSFVDAINRCQDTCREYSSVQVYNSETVTEEGERPSTKHGKRCPLMVTSSLLRTTASK